MIKVEPGTYDAVLRAAAIYEAPSGAVMCRMQVDVGGQSMSGGICLIQKDGTLSERGFRDVQAIFGWADWDWDRWAAAPESFAGAAVAVVVETVSGEHGEFSSIKYVNPPGGSAARLTAANAGNLKAKYGAKTRALFGGSPAGGTPRAAAAKAPPPPVAVPPPPPAPATPLPTSTMEEAWDAFCRANSSRSELELYAEWPKLVQAAAGKTQNDSGPEDWGKVLGAIGDNLPY